MTVAFAQPKETFSDVCKVPITKLIAAYRESIELLRAECSAEIQAHKKVEVADPNFGDDLYLLRFVLSHHKKGFASAKKALLETIVYRTKHQDTLTCVRRDGLAPPKDDEFRPLAPASPHFRNKDGHFLYLIRNGCTNLDLVMESVRGHEIVRWMTLSKEFLFGKCDAESRTQDRLVKIIYLMDFKYGSLLNYGGEFKEAMSEASKESELLYPQFLLRTIIYNIPFGMGTVLSFILKFFPDSVREKLLVCDETEPKKIGLWTYNHLNISSKDIPSYLGGKCECEHGCIRGIPNNQPGMITPEEAASRKGTTATWKQFGEKTVDRNKERVEKKDRREKDKAKETEK